VVGAQFEKRRDPQIIIQEGRESFREGRLQRRQKGDPRGSKRPRKSSFIERNGPSYILYKKRESRRFQGGLQGRGGKEKHERQPQKWSKVFGRKGSRKKFEKKKKMGQTKK